MYSNWLWHRGLQLLVDAGEGLQLALGPHVFAPSVLALTHGHSDHVLGIPGLLAARRFGKGAVGKPLTILFPEGSRGVHAIREFMGAAYEGVVFPVTWTPLAHGQGLALTEGKTRLEAFSVRHTPGEPALGFRVVEARRRLRPEFTGRPQAEIEALARQGRRDEMMERFDHVVFAHSGDAMPIDPAIVAGADLLVHDATFLHEPDRREPIHATTEEALDVGARAGARTLVLTHLSVRYDRAGALPALRRQVEASRFTGACWLLDDDRWIDLRG